MTQIPSSAPPSFSSSCGPLFSGSDGSSLSDENLHISRPTNLEIVSLSKLSSHLERLLLDPQNSGFTDADVSLDGGVGVHRCILAARSRVFRDLFSRPAAGSGPQNPVGPSSTAPPSTYGSSLDIRLLPKSGGPPSQSLSNGSSLDIPELGSLFQVPPPPLPRRARSPRRRCSLVSSDDAIDLASRRWAEASVGGAQAGGARAGGEALWAVSRERRWSTGRRGGVVGGAVIV